MRMVFKYKRHQVMQNKSQLSFMANVDVPFAGKNEKAAKECKKVFESQRTANISDMKAFASLAFAVFAGNQILGLLSLLDHQFTFATCVPKTPLV